MPSYVRGVLLECMTRSLLRLCSVRHPAVMSQSAPGSVRLRYGTWCSTPHPAFAIMDLMSIGMQTTSPRRMAMLPRRSLLVRARLRRRLSQLSCSQW